MRGKMKGGWRSSSILTPRISVFWDFESGIGVAIVHIQTLVGTFFVVLSKFSVQILRIRPCYS